MAIIITQRVQIEHGLVHAQASHFYINVASIYISVAYDLMSGDEIMGKIIRVTRGEEDYPDLIGKDITLILDKSIIFDRLYISKADWDTLFREWGLVISGYQIELRLTDAVRHVTGESIGLYTKKDITAV